jgi:hypothetical protein
MGGGERPSTPGRCLDQDGPTRTIDAVTELEPPDSVGDTDRADGITRPDRDLGRLPTERGRERPAGVQRLEMTADQVGLAREGRITPTIRPTRWVTQVAHESKSIQRQHPLRRDALGGHWRGRASERATRREEDLGRLSGDAARRVTAEARSRRMVESFDWLSLGRATADQHGHSLATRCQRAAIARSTFRGVIPKRERRGPIDVVPAWARLPAARLSRQPRSRVLGT